MEEGKSFRIRTSAPIVSVKDFSKFFYKDPELERLIKESFFYLIVQRQLLSFENIVIENMSLIMDIVQKGHDHILKVKLPLYQDQLLMKGDEKAKLESQSSFDTYLDKDGNLIDIHSIKIYKGQITPENFVHMIAPEWLIRDYYTKSLNIEIDGDITQFLNYKVHYIGISTEQKIVDRLKSHSNLQAILSEEASISNTVMNSLELGIMFFDLQGLSQYNILRHDVPLTKKSTDKFANAIMGNIDDDDRTVFKDAEKAFVSALKPNYNIIQFNSYPNRQDFLINKDYSFITYEFNDPFNLIFETTNFNSANGDIIIVTEEYNAQIIKFSE